MFGDPPLLRSSLRGRTWPLCPERLDVLARLNPIAAVVAVGARARNEPCFCSPPDLQRQGRSLRQGGRLLPAPSRVWCRDCVGNEALLCSDPRVGFSYC